MEHTDYGVGLTGAFPTERQAKEAAREQLRAQVRDFIKWLKAQGVI
jgi:hypothetical protein